MIETAAEYQAVINSERQSVAVEPSYCECGEPGPFVDGCPGCHDLRIVYVEA